VSQCLALSSVSPQDRSLTRSGIALQLFEKTRWMVSTLNADDLYIGQTKSFMILVIEDHPEWCPLLRIMLTEDGFEVIVVESGDEALQVVETVWPDLVLLGLSNWETNGIDIARRLRTIPSIGNIPIVLLANGVSESGCESSPGPFIDGHISRQNVISELTDCIRYHLSA